MTESKSNGSCVVCRGTPLLFERAYRPREGMFFESSVVRCSKCNLLQVSPMPTLDQLDAYYQSEYHPFAVASECLPYEDSKDVNFRTLSQAECVKALGIDPHFIVDVGCRFGLLLSSLRQTFPQARLFGVEVSEKCHPALSRL